VALQFGTVVAVVIASGLTLVSQSIDAQVYKCKDSTGKMLYSGQPCEYGDKPLPLSENTVQGQRTPTDYSTSSGVVGAMTMSPECVQAQRALIEQRSKPMPRGIVDANRHRGEVKQASRLVDAACGGGGGATTKAPSNSSSSANVDAGSMSRCPDGTTVAGSQGCWQCPDGSYVSGLSKSCQRAPDGRNVEGGRKVSQCPDGSFVGGTCWLGPDGKYMGK
jgi:hypothetical protein